MLKSMRKRDPVSGSRTAASTLLAVLVAVDPFAFFQPTVRLPQSDRSALEAGNAVARTVQAPSGAVAIVAAVPVKIDAARLVAWMRDIVALKQSAVVKQIGRFSPAPSLADVQGLTLDDADLAEIARCRPSSCGVKLSASEVGHIRAALGSGEPRSSPAVHQAFREVVVARATAYLKAGRETVPAPAFLETNWPALSRGLHEYPRLTLQGAESFLYWSKDAYGGKPIVSITHVTIVRGERETEPDVLVVGRDVFATHYVDSAWSFTALLRAATANYLVYLNQSQVDLLDSWYGGLVRRVAERRLREEAVDVLNGLRRRLESGDPPARTHDGS
jgi:hypothetical protein